MGSLAAHFQTQLGVEKGVTGQEGEGESGGEKPMDYRMEFPTKSGPSHCPVEGCSNWSAKQTAMRVHF